MREIKFRLFWKEDREMTYFDMYNVPTFSSEEILMQYTGLKDKNGVEIYFGDILQTSNCDEEYDVWDAKDYGYTVCKESPHELGVSFNKWYPQPEGDDSIYCIKFCEVIGNIYENPELLAKKK